MKNLVFIFVCLLLLAVSNNKIVAQQSSPAETTLSVACSPDLYNLANDWAIEFCKQNPEIKIKVTKSTDFNPSTIQKAGVNLSFVSKGSYLLSDNEKLWKMEIGKDALVPVINSKNPFLSEIKNQNISPVILAQIQLKPEKRRWNVLPKIDQDQSINYYVVNNQSTNSMVAKFLSSRQKIEGKSVENSEKLIAAILNDPYSIGFCKLSELVTTKVPNAGRDITVMPLDKNGNGKIEDFENIYCDLSTYTDKAWIGRFPKELINNIYSIASQAPVNQSEVAFLQWISSQGQQFLNKNGYSALVLKEKQSNLEKLGYQKDFVVVSDNPTLFSKIGGFFASISTSLYVFMAFILLLIIVGITMNIVSKDKTVTHLNTDSSEIFSENTLDVPNGLFFDKTHTWVFLEKSGTVRIGIDDFLQHVTGSITKVKLKNPGELVKKGEPILSLIQNGKQLCINSPVSGRISDYNETLLDTPSTINRSPYSKGWVYLIEPTNWLREIQFYQMAEKYKEWIKNEFLRLKDFLATTINIKSHESAYMVLQDGGLIKDNVLANLGPEVWEEFQTNFVDTMK